MFAGVVVFSVIGFKATATFDRCVEEKTSLISANFSGTLPICDLQKELDSVSTFNSYLYLKSAKKFKNFRAPLEQD